MPANRHATLARVGQHDAILVLGGGVRDGGKLPPWVESRFDLALERQEGETVVCLSAGTTHRPPPLDLNGFPIFESAAGAQYLIGRGFPAERIQIETVSYDTVGNAYFSKLVHVDPAGWRKLLVITSEFHMPRTRATFEWVYGMEGDKYQLEYAASPDNAAVLSRIGHERQRLESFLRTSASITNLTQLHRWIFSEHRAYTADRQFFSDRSRDAAVLESY